MDLHHRRRALQARALLSELQSHWRTIMDLHHCIEVLRTPALLSLLIVQFWWKLQVTLLASHDDESFTDFTISLMGYASKILFTILKKPIFLWIGLLIFFMLNCFHEPYPSYPDCKIGCKSK